MLSLDRVKKDFFCIERSCLVRAGSERFEGSSYVMAWRGSKVRAASGRQRYRMRIRAFIHSSRA